MNRSISFVGIFTPLFGAGLISSSVLTALSLNKEWPYLKAVEVYFYDSKNTEEKIKVWIEDLGNFSKVQYFKKNSTSSHEKSSLDLSNKSEGKWEYLTSISSDEERVKYTFLAGLAKNFFEVQHNLNLVKSLSWAKKLKSSSASENGDLDIKVKCNCKEKTVDCCECCPLCILAKDKAECKSGISEFKFTGGKTVQNKFNYFLNNLNTGFNNTYLTPVQSHINLSDLDFSSDFKNQSKDKQTVTKKMKGVLAYGFVDYNYIPKNFEDKSFYSNLSNEKLEISLKSPDEKEKYFFNIPQSFTFQFPKSASIKKKKNESGLDLSDIWKKLDNKNELISLIDKEIKQNEIDCCCSEEEIKNKKDPLNCLLGRNFIFEDELIKIQELVKKEIKDCCPKVAS